ncbi:hypothetical protein [Streptomyces sp. NPDC001292]|uniref:hypothetical protein n=1 Tax=Streptomyces sp. NPDC001292 TaxID=3364558 RepID=UPI0036B10D15
MPGHVDHEQRRSAIFQAVCRVVCASGAEGLTLRSVAAAAGCTTGMIAHDKKALVAQAAPLHGRPHRCHARSGQRTPEGGSGGNPSFGGPCTANGGAGGQAGMPSGNTPIRLSGTPGPAAGIGDFAQGGGPGAGAFRINGDEVHPGRGLSHVASSNR